MKSVIGVAFLPDLVVEAAIDANRSIGHACGGRLLAIGGAVLRIERTLTMPAHEDMRDADDNAWDARVHTQITMVFVDEQVS